jgi:hypothetical protein
MKRRPWKGLAVRRARRRRGTELPAAPDAAAALLLPPLVCPDEDREFVSAIGSPSVVEKVVESVVESLVA